MVPNVPGLVVLFDAGSMVLSTILVAVSKLNKRHVPYGTLYHQVMGLGRRSGQTSRSQEVTFTGSDRSYLFVKAHVSTFWLVRVSLFFLGKKNHDLCNYS